jgi:hypothetical protein
VKIKWFRSVRFRNDWELNFIGKVWNFRIGRSQLALWRRNNPLFDFFRRYPGGAWHDPVT